MELKPFLIIFTFFFLIAFTSSSFAQNTSKLIHLKDGSVLKAQVVSLANGVYTLHHPNLGEIKINESEIVSISDETSTPTSAPVDLKAQSQKMQQQIMADPQLMNDINIITSDPEIQQMLSNPKLLQSIMTYDPQKIEQDPDVKKLMENPKMKLLMEKMMSKMPAQ